MCLCVHVFMCLGVYGFLEEVVLLLARAKSTTTKINKTNKSKFLFFSNLGMCFCW